MNGEKVSQSLLLGKWTALIYACVISALVYGVGLVAGERVYMMVFGRGLIPHLIIVVSSLGLGFLIYQAIQIRQSHGNLAKLLVFVQNNREEIVLLAKVHGDVPGERIPLLSQLFKDVPGGKERELTAALFRDWIESGQDFALKRLEIHLDLETQVSENSFKIPLVLGWMAPMLGFLGTVWGIAQSLGNFTGFMGDVDNISRVKDGLGTITAGLGVAFDTTLVGLFFAILINGIATYLQRKDGVGLDRLERIALDVAKRLSLGTPKPEPVAQRGERAISDAASVSALVEATRDLAKHVQHVNRASVEPSSELMEAVSTLQHYVKYLAVLAKQSDTLASERQVVESAAEAVKSLKDFSEGLGNLNRASSDLLKAVKLLEKPREFRLVEHYSPKQDDRDE